MSLDIKITKYSRGDWNDIDHAEAVFDPVNKIWIIRCTMGPTWFYNHVKHDWDLAHLVQKETLMSECAIHSEESAVSFLKTVTSKKRQDRDNKFDSGLYHRDV